jgi:hypothetical protein
LEPYTLCFQGTGCLQCKLLPLCSLLDSIDNFGLFAPHKVLLFAPRPPLSFRELCLSDSDGVGLVSHLLSPSPPTAKSGLVGVPRSLDGMDNAVDYLEHWRDLCRQHPACRIRLLGGTVMFPAGNSA